MIRLDNSCLYVNIDNFVKNYYIVSSYEILIETLKKFEVNYHYIDEVIIESIAETPINIQPFSGIIKSIEKIFINAKITVLCRDQEIPEFNGKIERYTQWPEIISMLSDYNYLKFQLSDNPKLFGCLFGRISYPRLIIAHYLETVYPDMSFVTLLASKNNFYDSIVGLEDSFSGISEWVERRKNPFKSDSAENDLGTLEFPRNYETWPEIWGEYHFEIIVETNYHSNFSFTEKTMKCLASGKPFILMSGPGSLSNLRNMGFKTFNPYINEEYDDEENSYKRLCLIKNEIERVCNLDNFKLQRLLSGCYAIAQENMQTAKKLNQQNIFS